MEALEVWIFFYKEYAVAFSGVPSTIDNDIVGTEYCLGVGTSF